MNHGDYRGAERFAEILGKSDGGSKIPQIAKRFFSDRCDWREFYDGIDAMFLWQDTVYVIHDWNQYGQGERHYDVFRKTALIDNIRRFQRNPALTIDWKMLDIPSRRPTYRVSRNRGRGDEPTFNLFRPSPMLLQKPELSPWSMRLPEQWDLLLNNLAGVDEKEWLLNHMVTYVQTLEKPRTIPVLVGKQGTGKNTLFELFGRGIGGFIAVGNEIMESQFNDWLLNPVILLDEFFTDSRDTRKLKNKLKSLINEEQTVNIKHEKLITCRINNYIAMASNEYVTAAPVIVERRDRRYTIITGGKDTDLEMDPDFNYDELERQLPDFMLYLLSKAADVGAANRPLMNDARERLMEMMEDERLVAVREWVDQHRSESAQPVTQKAVMRLINLECDFRCPLTAQKLRPIIEELGVETKRIDNQWYYMGIRLPSHSGREEGPSPTSETENTWGRTPKKCLSLKI